MLRLAAMISSAALCWTLVTASSFDDLARSLVAPSRDGCRARHPGRPVQSLPERTVSLTVGDLPQQEPVSMADPAPTTYLDPNGYLYFSLAFIVASVIVVLYCWPKFDEATVPKNDNDFITQFLPRDLASPKEYKYGLRHLHHLDADRAGRTFGAGPAGAEAGRPGGSHHGRRRRPRSWSRSRSSACYRTSRCSRSSRS